MTAGTVAVVGSTGFTGRLVVDALVARGLSVRLVGRSLERLTAVAARHREARPEVVPVLDWHRGPLGEAITGCRAVVACAGPFVEVGRPVVEAALAARVPYCDSSGEQSFIQGVYQQLDAPARSAGIPLIPGFGFEFVPGDLGAALAADGLGPLERVDVVYAVESRASSAGSRRSGVDIMRSATLQWVNGALVEERLGRRRRAVDVGFAQVVGGSFPSGEPLMVPRHLDVRTVISHLALPGLLSPGTRVGVALTAAARLAPIAGAAARLAGRGPEGPDERARSARAACHVEARSLGGARRAILVEGSDIYGCTAELLAGLAERIASGSVRATGACAPAQVVEPASFLAAAGLSVRNMPPVD